MTADGGKAVDPESQFLAAPQTIDQQSGFIQGAPQLSIQRIGNPNQAPSATDFDFFEVVNGETRNGRGEFNVDVLPNAIKNKG